jgi:hypothetical protein
MNTNPASEHFVLNGVDGASGEYLTPHLTGHQVANLARRHRWWNVGDAKWPGSREFMTRS